MSSIVDVAELEKRADEKIAAERKRQNDLDIIHNKQVRENLFRDRIIKKRV